jgi:beta-ribofuranosylaminobenzene 5'-phosphate synthase
MNRIKINTPARLHFGLIDMNGERGRIDGGSGLALESPHTVIEAVKSQKLAVRCESEPEIESRVVEALSVVREKYKIGGVTVDILERPLPHVGLGSATQTLVGAVHALCKLYGLDRPSAELAEVVGRGGTSGIGVAAIETGGFIIDGGHPFRRGSYSKQEYTPSGSTAGIAPPPVLARYDFPDWDILLVVPETGAVFGEGASGLREVTLFKVVCPVPLAEVQRMCHILLIQMMPAVLEGDLEAFASAMEDYQSLGFKVFELRAQTQLLSDCLRFLKENGGQGAGMSSWGPSLYAFGEDLSELHSKAEQWLAVNGGGEAILTKANNVGMRITEQD